MPDKSLPRPSSRQEVDQFLHQVASAPSPRSGQGRGRLIFAMDATASRQPTWDRACQLQGDMFTQTRGLGTLDIQLCFYRGYDEFRVSPWHHRADTLLRAMSTVTCLGGATQIERVLRHALREHARNPVQALVFVGDCMEEELDALCQLAGKLGLLGVPLFLFQDGTDTLARNAFRQLARLSGGASCSFDSTSPDQLGELLNAVAVYATGGRLALESFSRRGGAAIKQLVHQLGGDS